jgi:hypothetical protein
MLEALESVKQKVHSFALALLEPLVEVLVAHK